ncbi:MULTISPECIES: DJ-1/PfpI family protein [unclassified Shinella]|uniref:DJ-1/PfpI family protein n=1 Tax=unclassified Shinella TaxID=2643062 RepID=UPI00225D1850|nr:MULTISPECIES: DJ-1/PfpI family protein [unclassified Shinella]MCO5137358.1 DJ-1/PfpI family protein [Shinella sp.]MDC7257466.1 DJ-1/PfpI family protein [Shinella sp. YE25]CAI0340365.1 DJ-1/PfpI family protein [Rhizobiaceae bacterium]CAK7258734.1 DJ-1/PfpI family protein [Shinella sp. WSC3-e]
MSKACLIWCGIGLIILSMAGFGGWLLSLPATTTAAVAPLVPQEEADAMLASLRPAKRERPLVAVIGINDATETTDYLVPTGILRRADVADVAMLATDAGPVQLYPALAVEPDATIAEFDAAHPEGADFVIVPAMSRDDDPAAIAWLRDQAEKGATVIGICAGAKVVGAAGLLDGKRATTHWYYLAEMLKRSPTIRYVADRRMVADAGVATTTGISASLPMMLTLVEAIAGRVKAEAVAHDLGLEQWDARHASAVFRLTRPFATTVLANRMAVWNRDEFGIRLEPGMDEVSLALVADAWSRTYRSNATSYAGSPDTVVTMNGIRIVPDRAGTNWPESRRVSTFPDRKPADTLDLTLDTIAARHGTGTANVVAMQLEYPRHIASR